MTYAIKQHLTRNADAIVAKDFETKEQAESHVQGLVKNYGYVTEDFFIVEEGPSLEWLAQQAVSAYRAWLWSTPTEEAPPALIAAHKAFIEAQEKLEP